MNQPAKKRRNAEATRARLIEAGEVLFAEQGFDPVYGARPLKRAIQQSLENGLAQDILSGRYQAGDTVKVDADESGLIFS